MAVLAKVAWPKIERSVVGGCADVGVMYFGYGTAIPPNVVLELPNLFARFEQVNRAGDAEATINLATSLFSLPGTAERRHSFREWAQGLLSMMARAGTPRAKQDSA
jgi:hypothetical protein